MCKTTSVCCSSIASAEQPFQTIFPVNPATEFQSRNNTYHHIFTSFMPHSPTREPSEPLSFTDDQFTHSSGITPVIVSHNRPLTIQHCNFTHLTSTCAGGAVQHGGSSLSDAHLTECRFSNCSSTVAGGALEISARTLTIRSSQFGRDPLKRIITAAAPKHPIRACPSPPRFQKRIRKAGARAREMIRRVARSCPINQTFRTVPKFPAIIVL